MHITGKEPSSLDFVNFYQSLLWTTKHLDMILDKPSWVLGKTWTRRISGFSL